MLGRTGGLLTVCLFAAVAATAATRNDGFEPCATIAIEALRLPDAAWTRGDTALAPWLEINDPFRQPAPSEQKVLDSPAVQSLAAEIADRNLGMFIDKLAGLPIYAVSVLGGTMHCQSTLLLRVAGEKATKLPPGPADFGEGDVCWSRSGAFGRAVGEPVFVAHDRVNPAAKQASFTITPWVGDGWGKSWRFSLEFRASYYLVERRCGADRQVCAAADSIAKDKVVAYNQARENDETLDALVRGSSPDAAAKAAVERASVKLGPGGTADFPNFSREPGDDHPMSYSGFYLFPIVLAGSAYVGALAHEGVGWREGPNTLLAIYSEKDGDLAPLAGFVFARSLAGLANVTIEHPEASGH